MLLDGLEPELHSRGTGRSGAGSSDWRGAGGPGAGGEGARAGSCGSWGTRLGSDGNGPRTGLSWGLRNGARTSSSGPGAGSNWPGRLGSNRSGPGLEGGVEDGEGSWARSSGLLLQTSTTKVDERLLELDGSGLSLDLLHLRLGRSSGLRLGKVDSGYGRSRSHGTR